MKKVLTIIACAMLIMASGCKKTEQGGQQQTPAPVPAPAPVEAPAAPAPAPADAPELPPPPPVHEHEHEHGPGDIHQHEPDVAPEALAVPENAVKTASGLQYLKSVENAGGKEIKSDDLVKMHYTGYTTDGHKFDSSVDRGTPATFAPGSLIPGMREALELSRTGEKVRVWIPQELAYNGAPGAPAGTLVFDFDILDVVTPTMPPKDVPEDAVKLENGVAYRISKPVPDARQVKEKDFVTLSFSGWTQNEGKLFHSTAMEGEPLTASVDSLFEGWKSVLPNVREGEEIQVWIPEEEGIFANAPEGQGEKGTLIFTLTVDKILALPDTPADVAAAPEDAEKTASGLASKVLKAGEGTTHPTANSLVRVNYSGWMTDGTLFDSSVIHGEPAVLPLGAVIPGWSEGLQLMVPGETRRLWIPENLAYAGQPGAPSGMLVFDVELLEIVAELPPHSAPGDFPPPPADAAAPADAPAAAPADAAAPAAG